ncbi:uncharacterized protein MONBRDRAFT_24858 [Monosiga brevicollis MX1]|uniref:WD repeat-containing protein 60 n=1 Tax=Monosiga brevicollis TaxID=81824 RepID=A9UXY6_MONBE|nr:uncharacterized protein MONBRDRAFT_24858 [Monosiga brevicollis MX1]EDQ89768.1 predicted protein [Monosiga brevicollis MX1]|eukprot:XP_001745190.1 hypothetical protein [Monosiga brevicollis MX1]
MSQAYGSGLGGSSARRSKPRTNKPTQPKAKASSKPSSSSSSKPSSKPSSKSGSARAAARRDRLAGAPEQAGRPRPGQAPKPAVEEAPAEDAYEDDFEEPDYEDDFESASEPSDPEAQSTESDSDTNTEAAPPSARPSAAPSSPRGQRQLQSHVVPARSLPTVSQTDPDDIDEVMRLVPTTSIAVLAHVVNAIRAENARSTITRGGLRPTTSASARPGTSRGLRISNETPTRSSAVAAAHLLDVPGAASPRMQSLRSASQRIRHNAALARTARRAKALSAMVTLETSSFQLLDIAPCSEYELYIRSYGKSGRQQAATQSGELSLEHEMQTEEIETCTRWTQYPADDLRGAGEVGATTSSKVDTDSEQTIIDAQRLSEHNDHAPRHSFLLKASRVVLTLLQEDVDQSAAGTGQHERGHGQATSPLEACGHTTTLAPTFALLAGRHVVALDACRSKPHLLLTLHAEPPPGTKRSADMGEGLICIWDLSSPSVPLHVLVSQDKLTCCKFGNEAATVAVAGTIDGAVLAWDLNESLALHTSRHRKTQKYSVRHPSFRADFTTQPRSHESAVVALERIGRSEDHQEQSNFQFVSLDEGLYAPKVDAGGSITELGLRPGSALTLVSAGWTQVRPRNHRFAQHAFTCLAVPQSNPSHILAGTTHGSILRAVRFGSAVAPSEFVANINLLASCPASCTAIDFCPSTPSYFLAVCLDLNEP